MMVTGNAVSWALAFGRAPAACCLKPMPDASNAATNLHSPRVSPPWPPPVASYLTCPPCLPAQPRCDSSFRSLSRNHSPLLYSVPSAFLRRYLM